MMRQRSNTSPILRLTRNLICIGIAAFLILFTQNEQFCKKIIPTTNEQLETYSDIKQIAARLEEEILSGSGSFSFYTTRLDPSQIQDINSYIDPTFGSANYQETTNNRLAPKTTIKIQLKPAYYVYAAIMQHKAIPNNETKAKRLYRVVNAVLKAKIKPSMTDYQKELALHDHLVKQCHYSTHSRPMAHSSITKQSATAMHRHCNCSLPALESHPNTFAERQPTPMVLWIMHGIS